MVENCIDSKTAKEEEIIKDFTESLSYGIEELYKKAYYEGYSDANSNKGFDPLGKENLDCTKLELVRMLEESLAKETGKSWNEFLDECRNEEKNWMKKIFK